MSAKVKDAAVQEAQQISRAAVEGAKSGAYLYPFKVRRKKKYSSLHFHPSIGPDMDDNRAYTTWPPTRISTNLSSPN